MPALEMAAGTTDSATMAVANDASTVVASGPSPVRADPAKPAAILAEPAELRTGERTMEWT